MGISTKRICSKKSHEIPLSNSNSRSHSNAVRVVQCGICFKWRIIANVEEYEKLRSNWSNDPFTCSKKPNVSCVDPSNLEDLLDKEWAIDCPDVPKTPAGFIRSFVKKEDSSKYEIYYIAPTGRKLRNISDVTSFLSGDPENSDLSISNFSFAGLTIGRPPSTPQRPGRTTQRRAR